MPEMPGVPCKPRRALCPAGGNRLLVSLEVIAVVVLTVVLKLAVVRFSIPHGSENMSNETIPPPARA